MDRVRQVCLTPGHQRPSPLLGDATSWCLRTRRVTFCKQRYYLHAVPKGRVVYLIRFTQRVDTIHFRIRLSRI